MDLGEKLRQARVNAGMTQRQLCGDEITRNMLSQIEHGTARPSMTTLKYLAKQLGLPVGYFLEEDAAVSSNSARMKRGWELYIAGEYADTLRVLEEYTFPDPIFDREHGLLKTLALLSLAEESAKQGKTVLAKSLLEEEAGIEPRWLPELCLRRMRIQRMLGQSVSLAELPDADSLLMLYADAAMKAGDIRRAGSLLDSCAGRSDSDWCFLRAEAAMAQSDYTQAVQYLQQAEQRIPERAIPLLEVCFRELGDYKSAYLYACKARNR